MGGLVGRIGVGVTRGEENVVDVFDEVFRRQEGHVNVKLGEEKMVYTVYTIRNTICVVYRI